MNLVHSFKSFEKFLFVEFEKENTSLSKVGFDLLSVLQYLKSVFPSSVLGKYSARYSTQNHEWKSYDRKMGVLLNSTLIL